MHNEFLCLTNETLHALAAALHSGRLRPPFTGVSLHPYCPEVALSVASRMQQLSVEGMNTHHLALLVESIAQARKQSENQAIDLVWSGPKTPELVNRGTGSVVRELFNNANEEVLLAGYAVYQGQDVFRSLAERLDNIGSLRVHLFLDIKRGLGDTTPPETILSDFAWRFREREWPGQKLPSVYYDPRSLAVDAEKRSSLHAKCVVVDRNVAFVSSANFTEAAQERNIEVGVLIRSSSFAATLADHFETLALHSLLLPLRLDAGSHQI